MDDIGVTLYKEIKRNYDSKVIKDKEIQGILKKVKQQSATLTELSLYARRLGELASEVLIEELTEEKLPNGVIYWNIAKKTIYKLIKQVHKDVNDIAVVVQSYIDKKEGTGIKPIEGDFPEERVKALIQKIVDISTGE